MTDARRRHRRRDRADPHRARARMRGDVASFAGVAEALLGLDRGGLRLDRADAAPPPRRSPRPRSSWRRPPRSSTRSSGCSSWPSRTGWSARARARRRSPAACRRRAPARRRPRSRRPAPGGEAPTIAAATFGVAQHPRERELGGRDGRGRARPAANRCTRSSVSRRRYWPMKRRICDELARESSGGGLARAVLAGQHALGERRPHDLARCRWPCTAGRARARAAGAARSTAAGWRRTCTCRGARAPPRSGRSATR